MAEVLPVDARAVLDFWFLPTSDAKHGKPRKEWFRKDAAVDATIGERFGALVETAMNGGLRAWDQNVRGALARILLLDQFTRNMFRGTVRAFAGDALALDGAEHLVAAGADRDLLPVERWFVYLPFEHAESLLAQEKSLALFRQLDAEANLGDTLDYAARHHDIIKRFGRFPHRNAILGRTSTGEELEFLEQRGSGF